MIIIDTYTARFDDAVRPRVAIRAGMLVRISESADAREYDAFRRRLAEEGLEATEFVRWMPRAKANIYRLSRR